MIRSTRNAVSRSFSSPTGPLVLQQTLRCSDRPLSVPTGPSVFQQAPLARLVVHASVTYQVLADHKNHDALQLIVKSSLVCVQKSQSLDEEDYALSPLWYGMYSVHVQMKFMV